MTEVFWFIIYLAIGAAAIFMVAFLGPVSILDYRLEETWDKGNGLTNVMYRIISPAICTTGVMFLIVVALGRASVAPPSHRWLSTLVYWMVLFVLKLGRREGLLYYSAVAVECAVSVLLAYLMDIFVVEGFMRVGIDIFDQSSLAFQLEVALFYVAVQFVISLSTRYQYKVNYKCHKATSVVVGLPSDSEEATVREAGRADSIDTSEKKLCSYVRQYGSLLPERFDADVLLRSVFYAIMAIEDYNRPAHIRAIERMTFPFGLSKTTGIMQQRCDRALSDEESVKLAVEYVSTMWDSYLRKFARSRKAVRGPHTALEFGTNWYRYDYESLRGVLTTSFSELYGDYSGTRVLHANGVIADVIAFFERAQYNLMPATIVAYSKLFPKEAAWFGQGAGALYWKDSDIVRRVKNDGRVGDCFYLITCVEGSIDSECITEAARILEQSGWRAEEVFFGNRAFCSIVVCGSGRSNPPRIKGWITVLCNGYSTSE